MRDIDIDIRMTLSAASSSQHADNRITSPAAAHNSQFSLTAAHNRDLSDNKREQKRSKH